MITIIHSLTKQQEIEFIKALKAEKELDEKYGYKVELTFANKCTMEEMMMKLAITINEPV